MLRMNAQAARIAVFPRVIEDVGEQIEPTVESCRIHAHIAPDTRIVVALEVIMQAGFGILVLAGEAQMIRDMFGVNRGLAEGTVLCLPDDHAVLGRQFLRRAEMVVVIV